MNASSPRLRAGLCVCVGVLTALLNGCGKSEDAAPRNTKEAASQLQQAFETAPPAVKQSAVTAAEAMQQGDYEKAVVLLQVARNSPNISVQQGLAIHHSSVTMEAQLISRMEAGDPNARRAYELLKRFKQK